VSTPHFLVHSPRDNVGVVVVEGLKKGADMLGVITETDKTVKLKAKADIPIGHKVAL
jgi:(2R)-sulfolactate sulfo-lyase subunit alpha